MVVIKSTIPKLNFNTNKSKPDLIWYDSSMT